MLQVRLVRYGRKELYAVYSPYNEELVEKIKQVPKEYRTWDGIGKKWDITALGIQILMSLYKGRKEDIKFNFEDERQREMFINIINKHRKDISKKQDRIDRLGDHNSNIIDYKNNLSEITKDFDYEPYLKPPVVPMPHQIHSAHFASKLLSGDGSCLFAMPTGTGKSLSALLTMEMLTDVKKVLFIVPANLRLNIQNEVHAFTNSFCYVPKIKKKKTGEYYFTKYKRNIKDFDECKYVVMSYDYFSATKFDANEKILSLGLHEFDVIVFDELHYLSNVKSNRAINIRKTYNKIVKKYLGLSATPLKGNLRRFFPILKMLKPEEYTSEEKFIAKYCGLRYFKKPEDFRAEYHQVSEPKYEELNEHLQSLMFRVEKEVVLKDLPPLVRNKIMIELTSSEKSDYDKLLKGFHTVNWDSNRENLYEDITEDLASATSSPLALMMRIRQFLAKVKSRKAIELIQEMNDYGESCLLFDMYKKPLYDMQLNLGKKTKLYTGDISADMKQHLVDTFQNTDEIDNLLLTTGAGAVGITLTKARNVILNTLALSPDENEQAIARAYRKGQKHSVFVYTLLVADTIDEEMYEYIAKKQALFDSVIDGKVYVDSSEKSSVNDILEMLKEKYSV